jgi:pilus assembly protein CpaD
MRSLHLNACGIETPGKAAGRRGRSSAALAALLFATALTGCTTYDKTGAILGPDDYRYRHPIVVSQQLETMDLPVGPDVPYLSARMRGNITGFAQKYATTGADTIAVVVPSHSPNQRTAARIGKQAKDALAAAGVPRRQIEMRTYPAGAEENEAPVRLAFSRVGAHVDGCGQWPAEDGEMWMKTENRSYYNFGCATQQNLAATTVNPLDLLYPRGMTPPDATRRATVLGAYQKGTNPSGQYDPSMNKVDIATGVGDN